MQHVERVPGDRHGVALGEPAVGRHRARLHAVGLALLVEVVEQRPLRLVRALDRHAAEPLAQLRRAARMVDVAVRQQDLLRLHADLGDGRSMRSRSPPGSTTAPSMVVGVPDQRAVLLEGRDRDDRRLEALGGRRRPISRVFGMSRSSLHVIIDCCGA